MSKLPFLPLYTNDYLGDTRGLTTEQHGAYLLLLFEMWNAGGSLVYDERMLARLTVVSPKRWHLVWPAIEHFFVIEDGMMTQTRLKRERQKADSIIEKRRNAGALGGAAKALKTNDDDLANAKQMGWQTSAISQPQSDLEIEKEKEEPKGSSKKKAEGSSKGTRLPEDWDLPDDWFQETYQFRLPSGDYLTEQEIFYERDRFRDYWHSQPGGKGVKLNWRATWRNWVRSGAARIVRDRHAPKGAGTNGGGKYEKPSLLAAIIEYHRENGAGQPVENRSGHRTTDVVHGSGEDNVFPLRERIPF
jgi:uncharacterized protein YdaU (DUF1376 family)